MDSGQEMLDTLLGGSIPSPFRHRQHLEVTVAAIGRFGPDDAELVLRGAISSAARDAGLATKYHDTITRFWCRFVAHAVSDSGPEATVDDLLLIAPALADKHAVSRHWADDAINSDAARRAWLNPDLEPMPTPATSSPRRF